MKAKMFNRKLNTEIALLLVNAKNILSKAMQIVAE